MPPVAKITAPARGSAAHDRGILDGRPPHVAAGPADPADQFDVPTQLGGNDVGPDPRIVGGQSAGRSVVGQRVAEDEKGAGAERSDSGIRRLRGHRWRPGPMRSRRRAASGCPRPRHRVRVYPDSCTQLALPMPPSTGQLSTGRLEQRGGQRRDQPTVRDQHHGTVGLVDAPFGLTGDQFRDQRQAAGGDVDPALAAVRGPPGVVAPRQPGAGGDGVDLEMRQALPVAEMGLAQPGVDGHRQPRPLARAPSRCRARGADPTTRSAAAGAWRAPRRRRRPARAPDR